MRLLVSGHASCGGSLLSNSWVLTADSCVGTDEAPVEIAFGEDSSHPEQIELVDEVVRFPGNDGSDAARGRNLVLLRTGTPFEVAGSSSNFETLLWHLRGGALGGAQVCAGWSFSQPGTSRNLRLATLIPFAIDMNQTVGGRGVGDRVWWIRSYSAGSIDFALPTVDDLGSGCFLNIGQLSLLASVHTEIPQYRRDHQPNDRFETISTGLAEPLVRRWVDASMMTTPDYLPLPPLGPVAVQLAADGELELIGTSPDDSALRWFRRRRGDWREVAKFEPPEGLRFNPSLRPAVIIRATGDADLLAVDEDGLIWWKRRSEAGSWSDWAEVVVDAGGVTSGLQIAEKLPGHFYVAARGSKGALVLAEFDGGRLRGGVDLGALSGAMSGEPAIDVPQEGRVNIWVTSSSGDTRQIYLLNGEWGGTPLPVPGAIASSPVVGRWSLESFDFLARLPGGRLGRARYMGTWSLEWSDLGLTLPSGELTMALRGANHGELFVSEPAGSIWHVAWPR